ncbi:MAG: hypothetical protein CVU53_04380 [Deltaproteobacteria bacterium HGW-Deltaproteobacteria-11]|nr:MAG: hypothetical protein CVU53_04380 [Deltaproteobacteria bacterium HGW-Deltaproteobacteria-11]
MSPAVNNELEENVLFAAKIMVNILAEALIGAKVQSLSAPQYRILDMIYSGVDKPAELARMLDISPPAVSWTLTKLEGGGFVDRSHTKEDRRRVVLELTGMGKDVVRRVNVRRRKLISAVLGRMDYGTIKQLETSLGAFTESYLQMKGEKRAGDHV